jgi:hypothetical protein
MGRVNSSFNIANLKDEVEKSRYIQLCLEDIIFQMNGSLKFGENIKTNQTSVSFTAPDVDTPVNHGLGFVPSGYIMVGANTAIVVFDGFTPSTNSVIFLRSSAVGIVRLLFY